MNRDLVRRSVTGVFQCCVELEKGIAILKDIHQGECGHHAASRSLVAKAFRHGFFWPTAMTFIADITTRYGVPHNIITDNGTNFAKGALARFYATQGIRLDLASVAHP